MIRFAEASFGGLDVVVNNASAPYEAQGPLSSWPAPMQVDLLGAMYGIFHGVRAIERRGGHAIVYVSSTSALGHGRKHSKSPA
jgi:NAD(P)-dependent dehydrogenase (short-subunit alcohol dehydrogenase family)